MFYNTNCFKYGMYYYSIKYCTDSTKRESCRAKWTKVHNIQLNEENTLQDKANNRK